MADEKKKKRIVFSHFDNEEDLKKNEFDVLDKSIVNSITDIQRGKTITHIAFDSDPLTRKWQSLYIPKENLIPDYVLKRVAIRDDLVAAIWMARANQIARFGRQLQDRFAYGYRLEPNKGIMDKANPEEKKELVRRIDKVSKLLNTCGYTDGIDWDDRMTLATFLYEQARNAIIFGRFATLMDFVQDENGNKVFHSFRPVDAGTVYQAAPQADRLDNIRRQAIKMLEDLNNTKLRPERFENNEYAWCQVIQGRVLQAFTPEELIVHNTYPTTDIEFGGYPITPIDTAIDAILTHMNITTQNKLYFQSGRAARGMVVIKSADINMDIVNQIKQHFNASINSVSNSFRVPVFGIDPDEEVSWEPLEFQGSRDMEFQYLADQNARVILSAFQMSPEELPGYAHLSRGSNNQALSESNNEYKLEAARDVGIRPLLLLFQDFLNESVLPQLDPVVAKFCVLKLYGLDSDSREKENTNIQTELPLHGTYDGMMSQVEKEPLGAEWGGDVPMNPGLQGVWDKYLYVDEVIEHVFKRPQARKDENLRYIRDPFWFNYQQLKLQTKQMEQQQQQMAQQQQAQQQQAQQQQAPQEDEGDKGEPKNELTDATDQLMGMLKSEDQLHPNQKRLLAQHKASVKAAMDEWEKEAQQAKAEILDSVKAKKDE